ncbi:lipase [Actinorhabdospora filicis]|uniref:Lipase n=1 Tax=Actinorhabdospora filicis TaxID=1785913 RepID=A0A9W6SR50_9ACTN|nr:lipase [Actinorhabdospora filicis]GLZ80578.1 lipase [Actinorhabdospora filicis]
MRKSLIAAVAMAGVLLAAAPASASASPHLSLPAPTGPFAVGVHDEHLVDAARPDPWHPEQSRELMVSVRYPTLASHGRTRQYATAAESTLALTAYEVPGPKDVLTTVPTRSLVDAPIVAPWRLPTVLLSPGYGAGRWSLTSLAEDLASRGYLVVTIDHNYEAFGITFPDGHTTDCDSCLGDDGPKVVRGRGADASFVLDSLLPRWPIDPARIAMAGHSIGGAAAAYAMALDPRIKAGINMDGSFQIPPTVDRAFLMLGTTGGHPRGAGTDWDTAWNGLGGWRRWLTVDGAAHMSFGDTAVLAGQLGLPDPEQTITGERAVALTRGLVGAFLDRHLRGLPGFVLDHPPAGVTRWG